MTVFLNPKEWHSPWGSAVLNHVKINKKQLISEAELCYLYLIPGKQSSTAATGGTDPVLSTSANTPHLWNCCLSVILNPQVQFHWQAPAGQSCSPNRAGQCRWRGRFLSPQPRWAPARAALTQRPKCPQWHRASGRATLGTEGRTQLCQLKSTLASPCAAIRYPTTTESDFVLEVPDT